MKLITLNTWGGRIKEPFLEFVKNNYDIDIFCFQELYYKAGEKMKGLYPQDCFEIFTEIKELLPMHEGFFKPTLEGVYGIGIFIKKELNVLEEGEITIHYDKRTTLGIIDGHHSRNLQWIEFEINQKKYTVVNVHGLWNGKGKTDSPDRLDQSKRIKEFMDKLATPNILCGDFNLRPDTESLKIIAEGMDDHVEIHKITSTRTSLYKKEEKFADYIFTSPEVKVHKFEVLKDEVSDHSPLFLDFE